MVDYNKFVRSVKRENMVLFLFFLVMTGLFLVFGVATFCEGAAWASFINFIVAIFMAKEMLKTVRFLFKGGGSHG